MEEQIKSQKIDMVKDKMFKKHKKSLYFVINFSHWYLWNLDYIAVFFGIIIYANANENHFQVLT